MSLTFPSTEWFQALADVANADEGYKKFGTLEAIVAMKVGERVFNVTFHVREARDVREITSDEMRDADFVIDLTPDQWRAMIEDIKANEQAGRDHTLNSLDLVGDDPIHYNVAEDGYRADKFFRYNPSLQRFFDNAHQLDTVFDLAAATA
jgi:hypothetical protein